MKKLSSMISNDDVLNRVISNCMWYKFFCCLNDYEDAISGYELEKTSYRFQKSSRFKGLSFQINMLNIFKNNVVN